MDRQLLGVMVGALIGFAGTYLISRLEGMADKEKRREERRWHYRQEEIARIRPAWERLYRYLFQYVSLIEDLAKVVDSLVAMQETERYEEIQEIRTKLNKTTKALSDLEQPKTQPSDLLTIFTTQDPEMRKTIIDISSETAAAKQTFESDIMSLIEKYVDDLEVDIHEAEELVNRLAVHRGVLIEGIRKVEASIERYVTRP